MKTHHPECLDPNTSDERLRALAICGEDDTVDISLLSRGSSTLHQIKIIREYLDIGLKEAMLYLDNLPQPLNQPRPSNEAFQDKIPQRLIGLSRERATSLQQELQLYNATTSLQGRVLFHPIYSRLAAQNPALSVGLYQTLAKSADEETRKHLAKNPAAPLNDWLRLAAELPEEALQNPTLPLWLMEDLPLVSGCSLPFSLVQHALRSPEASPSLCRLFLSNHSFCREAADDPLLLPVWLELLSASEDAIIRRCIARNKSTPEDVLRRLHSDPDQRVREIARSRLDK
jgi:ribosomal protein L7/L12